MSSVSTMSLSGIKVSPAALRQCDTDNENYVALRDSINVGGVLQPLLVREKTETLEDGTSETYYQLVDGLQRYTACQELGITEVDVKIGTLSDVEALQAQIITNVHRVETKPVEYTKALLRLMSLDPSLTVPDIATRVAQSSDWLNKRFNMINKLDERLLEIVNAGQISITNALQLVKLPKTEQIDFVQQAQTESSVDFVKTVKDRVSEINTAAKEGREAEDRSFELTIKQRKLSEIKAANEDGGFAASLVSSAQPADLVAAVQLGIQWVLSIDPVTAAERETVYNDTETLRTEKKAQAKTEREKKAAEKKDINLKEKADEAAKVAAELEV